MIVRELGERGSSSSTEENRVLARAIFLFYFLLFCRNSFDRDVGQFAAK